MESQGKFQEKLRSASRNRPQRVGAGPWKLDILIRVTRRVDTYDPVRSQFINLSMRKIHTKIRPRSVHIQPNVPYCHSYRLTDIFPREFLDFGCMEPSSQSSPQSILEFVGNAIEGGEYRSCHSCGSARGARFRPEDHVDMDTKAKKVLCRQEPSPPKSW